MKINLHKKIQNKHLVVLILAIIFLTVLTGGMLAKYVQTQKKSASVSASEFYFESNLLKKDGQEYMLNADTGSISFDLRNYPDASRYAEMDIDYEVTECSGLTLYRLGVSDASKGVLKKDAKSKDIITLSGFESGKTYKVEVKGSGGYSQTLSATFIVRTQNTGVYKFIETNDEKSKVYLTVWTENISGKVTFSVPAGLIPDPSKGFFKNFGAAAREIDLAVNGSARLEFIIPNTYDGEMTFDFTVQFKGEDVMNGVPRS